MAIPTSINTTPPSNSPYSPTRIPSQLAELKTDQAHGDTDTRYHERRQDERDVVGPEREADNQIVDAQGRTDDDQMADAPVLRNGIRLVLTTTLELGGHDPVQPREGEDRTTDDVGMIAEHVGERATDHQAENRHPALENSEDERYLQAQLRVET